MKILRNISILLLLCTLLAASVSADIIIEPDDTFWASHQGDCDYLYRAYTVNGAEGYAALWESPASSRQLELVANGETVYGNWLYTDDAGVSWCGVSSGEMSDEGYEKLRGWIDLRECVPVPDYISFEEAHGAEFIAYDGSCDAHFVGLEEAVLWEYPGSGKVVSTVDAQWFREGNSLRDTFDLCWRDGEGRLWGYVVYAYGIRNTWVCLSDPGSSQLPADPDVLPEPPQLIPPVQQLPPASSGISLLAAGLVAVVTLLSLVLIIVLFRRKRTAAPEHREIL